MLNFFFGVAFAYFLLPILESLTSTICTGIEVLKAKYSVKITEYNSQMARASSELDVTSVARSIGFQYVEEEDEEEYEN